MKKWFIVLLILSTISISSGVQTISLSVSIDVPKYIYDGSNILLIDYLIMFIPSAIALVVFIILYWQKRQLDKLRQGNIVLKD